MKYVLDLILTIINVFLCLRIIKYKCSIKNDELPLRILAIAVFIIIKSLIVYLNIPPLNAISFILMYVFIIKIMCKCSFSYFIIFLFTFVFFSLSSDSLAVLTTSFFKEITISDTLEESSFILQRRIMEVVFQIILSQIIITIIGENKGVYINKWHELTFYVALVLFETGIFIYLTYSIQDYVSGNFVMVIMIGFAVLDIYMIYILQKISSSRDAENKLKLMHQQEQIQMHMYIELQNRYDFARSISHDIYRHVRSLHSLISENDLSGAEQYLEDLYQMAKKLRPTIKNQNPMFAIILNILAEHCEKECISLDMDIEDIPLKFISDIDITTIFSNIFDNAVEACQKVEISKRKINVLLQKNLNLITIKVTNTCVINFDFDVKKISGIGLSNIKNTIQKYDGITNINSDKENFEIFIILPVPDK